MFLSHSSAVCVGYSGVLLFTSHVTAGVVCIHVLHDHNLRALSFTHCVPFVRLRTSVYSCITSSLKLFLARATTNERAQSAVRVTLARAVCAPRSPLGWTTRSYGERVYADPGPRRRNTNSKRRNAALQTAPNRRQLNESRDQAVTTTSEAGTKADAMDAIVTQVPICTIRSTLLPL